MCRLTLVSIRERTWSQMLVPVICAPVTKNMRAAGAVPPRSEHDLPLKTRHFSPSPRQKRPQSAIPVGALPKTCAFPHFFPQLWKTSGGDPTAILAGEATVTHGFGGRQPCAVIDSRSGG